MRNGQKYLTCSEEHELEYVAEQQADVATRKKRIKEQCAAAAIHYSRHDRVSALPKDAGFAGK